tara:strand:+ start:1496 stop:2917 length:1422 start_codon:yes stop_codon:yes gene_type:complete
MKIEFKNISKSFGETTANSQISFSIESGSIHAIVGENGAGKSTLIKILSGQILPDEGTIKLGNKKMPLGSTIEATNKGIGILGQDPLDFSNFTVLESFLAGNKKSSNIISKSKFENIISNFSKKFDWEINVNSLIKDLSVGQRQQLELIRLLYLGAKIIILDEPTSGFSLDQKRKVFENLRDLTSKGYTVILVSHKIEEILEICNKATILQKGEVLETLNLPVEPKILIDKMFGDSGNVKNEHKNTNRKLEKKEITLMLDKYLDGKKITLTEGSIIGVSGLQGSGSDKFVQSFYDDLSTSKVYYDKDIQIPFSDINYVASDRLEKGLFSDMTIMEHIALAYNSNGLINWSNILELTKNLINIYGIVGTPQTLAKNLSGGNQQRLMLALIKENIRLLLLEQPTRGLDISSAIFVWESLLKTKSKKNLVIFSSVDLDEIYDYSDFIICFYDNKIVSSGYKNELPRTKVMEKISGK